MISWSDYIMLILLCLGVYYIFILVRHFPEKIQRLFNSRKKADPDDKEEVSNPDT
jgi:hypothetical protein